MSGAKLPVAQATDAALQGLTISATATEKADLAASDRRIWADLICRSLSCSSSVTAFAAGHLHAPVHCITAGPHLRETHLPGCCHDSIRKLCGPLHVDTLRIERLYEVLRAGSQQDWLVAIA